MLGRMWGRAITIGRNMNFIQPFLKTVENSVIKKLSSDNHKDYCLKVFIVFIVVNTT